MTLRSQRTAVIVVALLAASCAPLTDEVFAPVELASTAPIVLDERAGVVEIPIRLAAPREHDLSVAFRLVAIDAQDDCQQPDFGAAEGQIVWPAGALEEKVRVWIEDDDLAERDERFELRLEARDGVSAAPLGRIQIVIADDDRSALLDASELGVLPDVPDDQSELLQTVLDRAAELGRGVVVMAPGDYEITSVSLTPGTTLSAHDVRWHRPALSTPDTVSLRLSHEGSESSQPSLVEGLTIDGRRESQGPYRNHEREEAHLVAVNGDAEQGGALRASFEDVALSSGTGSGLLVGPDSEVTVCGLHANELWRDALTLNGGATRLRIRDLDATASEGTGLWLGALAPGFADSYRVDVEAEDLSIGAGDIEIQLGDASQVVLRRLTMTEPPIRLDTPGGSVSIEDSVLMLGPPSLRPAWAATHDVELLRTTLVASAADADAPDLLDSSAISVISQGFAPGAATPGSGLIAFSDCRFELVGTGATPADTFAIANADPSTAVVVTSSQLGAGFSDWFAPECIGCELSP